MTGTQLATLIRRKTRTTTATYSDADMLVDVNQAMEEIAGRIQTIRPEIWNMLVTFDLVADQREYSFPADVLNSIVSLELKFTSSGDYVPANALRNVPHDDVLQESIIVGTYNNSTPDYFIRRKAIYLLSSTITAVTDGGRIVYNAFPATLPNLSGSTDLSIDPTTITHGFPREFHELLARHASIAYKDLNSIPLGETEKNYENDLEKKLDEFSIVDQSLEEIASVPRGTSNDGFNL